MDIGVRHAYLAYQYNMQRRYQINSLTVRNASNQLYIGKGIIGKGEVSFIQTSDRIQKVYLVAGLVIANVGNET